MKKAFGSTLLIIMVLVPNILSARWRRLPVLVYHHIQEKVNSDVACTPNQFQKQMQAILDAGYTPLSFAQIRLYLAGGQHKDVLPVAITFDDGYESLYQYAFPVAKKYKIPMAIFLITSRIGKKPQFTKYLSISEIREMVDSGYIEFGSHSDDFHTDIMRIYDAFDLIDNPIEKLVKRDLLLSYRKLKIVTGTKPIALAWPYGKYNANTTKIAKKIGFKLHFTSDFGYNDIGGNPFAIKRVPVTSRDTPETVLKKLRGYL